MIHFLSPHVFTAQGKWTNFTSVTVQLPPPFSLSVYSVQLLVTSTSSAQSLSPVYPISLTCPPYCSHSLLYLKPSHSLADRFFSTLCFTLAAFPLWLVSRRRPCLSGLPRLYSAEEKHPKPSCPPNHEYSPPPHTDKFSVLLLEKDVAVYPSFFSRHGEKVVKLTVLAVNSTEARWTLADVTNEGVSPVGLADLTRSSVVARIWMTRAYDAKK